MKVVTHVEGKHRRISDYIAASPWAVQINDKLRRMTRSGHPLLKAINTKMAEMLVGGRTTVVFSDEVANQLRWSELTVKQAVVQTPGVMPPFRQMVVEARTGADKVGHDFVGLAISAESLDLDESPRMPDDRDIVLAKIAEHRRHEVRAIVVLLIWVQTSDGVVQGPIAEAHYPITRDFRVMVYNDPTDYEETGQIRIGKDPRRPGNAMIEFTLLTSPRGYEPDDQEHLGNLSMLSAGVFIRTCGLMNASNVKMVEGGRTNEHVSPKRRAKDHLAVIRYHVLKLKVGTKWVPMPSPKVDGGGRPTPLNIVRGHFKDYSKNGLFGKYAGEKYSHVWVPDYVKGCEEDGIVIRDYEQEEVREKPLFEEEERPGAR